MTRPDIALCYGTRPQVIKASVLGRCLGEQWAVVRIDTGQHYDYVLNALLYEQLGVRAADHCLEVGSGTHAQQTAAILIRAEELLSATAPRTAVVIGDTNSTLGCALAAAKLGIPVVHVEAGLRASQASMAEEINRRIVDSIASLLCTPSASATARLIRERPDASVVETGDVARDVLEQHVPRAVFKRNGYPARFIFATLHRAELTERPDLLKAALESLSGLDTPVILSLHPRTQAAIEANSLASSIHGSLRVIPAVGYLESLGFIKSGAAVITDSGGVQREAYWLGKPCITLRKETEWSETIDLGANRLVDPDEVATRLASTVGEQLRSNAVWNRDAYGIGAAASRVSQALGQLLSRGH
jgi:UDP-N-acetylglucosamine 2-epimerase